MPSQPPRSRKLLLTALVACALASAWRMTRPHGALGQWLGNAPPAHDPTFTPDVPRRVVAEARLAARPGAEVTLGAETAGRIARMRVQERDAVRRGDLVAEIEADEQRAAVAEAEARLAEIDIDIPLYESRVTRAARMAPSGGVSVDELEQRHRDLQAAHIRRKAAAATLDRLRAALAKCDIRAPIDGTVTARFAHAGQTIDPAARIVTIADLDQTRIEAEVNEFDAPLVKLGALAVVTAEGHPGQTWPARVEEIPATVTTRQLRPQDPGRPSDTGVLLVKLVPLQPTPFKLHQRLEVTIDATPTPTPVATTRD